MIHYYITAMCSCSGNEFIRSGVIDSGCELENDYRLAEDLFKKQLLPKGQVVKGILLLARQK